jgi:uncharacterized protein (TIRG00374 family)
MLLSLLKWIFSGGMLFYALHEIDGTEVVHMITQQNLLIPVAVIALMIFQMFVSTFRWQRILVALSHHAYKPAFGYLFRFNYVSIFFNSCLPGTIGGDVVRAMLLKGKHTPLTLCAHSVIIDRLMAVIAIFMMVSVSLPWLGKIMPLPVNMLLCICVASIIISALFLLRAPQWLRKLPSSHLIRMAISVIENSRYVIFSRDFPLLLAQAIFAHGCFCMAIYLLGISIGASFTFWDALVMIPPVLLIIMLPISMGGWGIREVSMVGMLALIGVPKEAALTISVQMGVLGIIASLPGAWFYIRRQKPVIAESAARQS